MNKVLAIYGGPRRNKNTETILNSFLDGIDKEKSEIKVIILSEFKVTPCTSCYGCSKTGKCVINDDMEDIYDQIQSSNIIVLASPIYFGSVSAITKSMIDRCQAFWSAKYLAGLRKEKKYKKGYFISTSGAKGIEMFQPAIYTVKLFFAACDTRYEGDILANDTDQVPVNNNVEALEKAFEMGRNINRNIGNIE